MKMDYFKASLLKMLHLCAVVALVSNAAVPAPDFAPTYEEKTNMTIDQLITNSLGGTEEAANQIMDFGDDILAELDMFLTKKQFLNMYHPPDPSEMIAMGIMDAPPGSVKATHHRKKRKAARDMALRWPDAIMPYKFAKGHFEVKEEYMIRRAMTEWERYTCVRFRSSTDADQNSTYFQNGFGCNSQLGMVGGIQMLNLQKPGCRFKGLYLHEIGHALGLVHEHQLPDRDNYIRILYHNVSPHMRIWFNKYTTSEVNQMKVPYQLSSVMHYGITAFSKDGKSQTIEAKDKSKEDTIGRVYLKELAYTDVFIVNTMYKCGGHCKDQTKCGPRGHLDQNCNCICEDGSSDCDRTKTRRTDNCRNEYDSWSCYIWANQGECERNPFYMERYCKKACFKCDGDRDSGVCKDKFEKTRCEGWRERGDCVTNAGWMKSNCKSTCNLCREDQRPEVNCANTYSDSAKCDKWAREGECVVNPVYMFKNCRKSCQMCNKDNPGTTTSGGGGVIDEDKLECKDTHKNCKTWADSRECQDNPDWMIANCRMSCQKCDDGTCKNMYDDTKCEIWQQKKQCLTNAKWMQKNCAKACRVGVCAATTDRVTSSTQSTRVTDRNTGRVTRPTTTVSGGGSCENRHSSDTQCNIWAKNDHCNINPSWMNRNCAKACGKCGQSSITTTTPVIMTTDSKGGGKTLPACADTNTQCPAWAKAGFCDSHPRYNLIHCKKSCNNCNGCRDNEILCSVWADADYCRKNPRYMLRECQKSCKACIS